MPLPAVAAKYVEATVIANSCVGIDGDLFDSFNEGLLGQNSPGKWRLGMAGSDCLGWLMSKLRSHRIGWKQGCWWSSEQVFRLAHDLILRKRNLCPFATNLILLCEIGLLVS